MRQNVNWILIWSLLFGCIYSCQTYESNPEVRRLNEDIWGEAGGVSYQQAAQKMQSNHPEWTPLDPKDKRALKLVFGELTEKIRLHWNAQPLNEWASDEYGIAMIGEHAEAQTYGYEIYLKGPRSAWADEHRLETLIHELTHSLQFSSYNASLIDYGNIYFREYYLAGQSYAMNKLEVEARNKANIWLRAVMAEFAKQQ